MGSFHVKGSSCLGGIGVAASMAVSPRISLMYHQISPLASAVVVTPFRAASSSSSSSSSETVTGVGADDAVPLLEQQARENAGSGGGRARAAGDQAKEATTRRPTTFFPKKGQDLELVCESLAFKGNGVCKVVDTGFVVLCERALPGERLIARICKSKRGFAEAYKLKTLSVHRNAVAAPCKHFVDCGGCKTQNLAYRAQLYEKEQQVHDLISRIGRFGESEPGGPAGRYMKPIVPCEKQFHYRNKMEFSFGTQAWVPMEEFGLSDIPEDRQSENSPENFALGLHAPKRFDRILPITECLLQDDVANQILDRVQRFCKANSHKMPAYDSVEHKGFLRHLILRTGRDSDTGTLQIMVNLVTSSFQPDLLRPLVNTLVDEFPQIVSFLNNVTSTLGPASVGQEEHVLHGGRTITEFLRGVQFQISANSFFQTNTIQAEILYELVEEQCNLNGDGSKVVLDLFCGTGTIGLSIARRVKHVYGFEIVAEAVADARRNAQINGIYNATFIQGDLNKLTAAFGTEFPKPDIVIADPNRPGMHPKLIQYLLSLRAERIIYVSCNPATCARDLDLLCHGGQSDGSELYHLASVQPVDMFPHTPHVECVCVLELRTTTSINEMNARIR